MKYAEERLRAIEKEFENLKWDFECARDEARFFEERLEQADRALAEMWQHLPKDKKALLMDENDYIEEMFWNERHDVREGRSEEARETGGEEGPVASRSA